MECQCAGCYPERKAREAFRKRMEEREREFNRRAAEFDALSDEEKEEKRRVFTKALTTLIKTTRGRNNE